VLVPFLGLILPDLRCDASCVTMSSLFSFVLDEAPVTPA
jgi:hypothetical protein